MSSAVEDVTSKLEKTKIENVDNSQYSDEKLLEIGKDLDLEEINTLLDKLYIELLDLTEQYIRSQIEVEKRQNEGNLLIAKARYIQGGKTVSVAQLPTDESLDFNALISTSRVDSDENLRQNKMTIEKHPIDKSKGYLDPIKWFGVLVPRCLHFAKERYQLATELVVDAANIQQEIIIVISYIEQLKKLKKLKDK